jgi:DNA-directed RNA polymerase specialized sigma24 family protein
MAYGLKCRTMTELHPVIYDLVPSVANTIYRRYKAHVEKDDIKQELMAWAMTRAADHTEDLMEPIEERRRHNEQRIAWQMRRVAERYARREKASKSGYQTNDEAYYESATLGQLLPFVIASIIDGTVLEQAQEMIRDGQPKGSSSPAEGGNLLANLIDIKRGFLKLDQDDQMVLRLRHHENFTLQQIAQVLECAISTADRRCAQSLRRLQDNLGGISPWQ